MARNTGTREPLLARQPILDSRGVTVGYELLHRPAGGQTPSAVDGAAATASVLVDGVLGQGLAQLTAGLPAWVNVPDPLLLDGSVAPLLGDTPVVVEVLEETRDTAPVRAALQALRERGVRVALDDVTADDPRLGLVGLVDVLKLDVMATTAAQRRDLVALAAAHQTEVLFEKVESHLHVEEAMGLGVGLLQGYFFARPSAAVVRDVSLEGAHRLQLLQVLCRPEVDLAVVEALVRQDVYLAQRFLAFMNSASFAWRRHLDSIRHALVLLGDEPLRRWLTLVTLASVGTVRSGEVLVVASTRARFCENLSRSLGLRERGLDLFLLGMFSVLEALLAPPLEDRLRPLGLADDVHAALLGRPSPLGPVLDAVHGLERADWEAVDAAVQTLGLDPQVAAEAFADAMAWGIRMRTATGSSAA